MSWSSREHSGDLLTKFSTRIIAEIQKNTIKRGKRNPISRRYHAKDDKEAIAAWKLELNWILHIFNVRYVVSMRLLLTFRYKTELGTSARATASGTHQDPADKPTVAPDIRRNEPKSRAVGSQNQPVSSASALLVTD